MTRRPFDSKIESAEMIPAKNRDRKCSTCRHYQPSPLWRKGWCRNPLLYDRNTNHLVEADSLACNRTFIDYWEPITGPTPQVAPQARYTKPRIAPSIPIGTTDAQGNRDVVTGNTPASGMAALTEEETLGKESAPTREPPKLSFVMSDFEAHEHSENGSKVTRMIEQIPGPAPVADPAPNNKAVSVTLNTAAERIRQARKQQARLLNSSTGRVALIIAAVIVLAAIVGGIYMAAKGQGALKNPSVLPSPSVTRPAPTPTGFGEVTATPVPTNTPIPPPPGVMGVNGWAQVKTSGLTMRATPGLSGAKVTVLSNGMTARIIGGPETADGITWWKLDATSKNAKWVGWCSGQFLAPVPPPK